MLDKSNTRKCSTQQKTTNKKKTHLPSILQLTRPDVVNTDDESLGVASKELLHLDEVLLLSFSGERHFKRVESLELLEPGGERVCGL